MMTPILEVSKESSTPASEPAATADAPSTETATATDAAPAWPPSSNSLNKMMAQVAFANASNCKIALSERLPVLDLEVPVVFAGIDEEVLLLVPVDSETSSSNNFLGELQDGEGSNVIIKTASPPCPWEFHILTTLQNRLQANPSGAANIGAVRRSFPKPLSVHYYTDAHMFALEYMDNNTLSEVIQMNKEQNKDMPEEMVMFYTLEMLKLLEGMHAAKIVHGKFDGAAMKIRDEEGDGHLAITYSPAGKGGWDTKGLCLTDFDHSVDFEGTPAGQQYSCRAGAWEGMVEYPAWTYEVDYHGLCSTVHQLLHRGKEMELVQSDEDGSWAPAKKFMRFWQFGLWEQLFDTLLNVEAGEAAPLAALRQEFESYLAKNPYKAKAIKSQLERQEAALEC